MNKYFIALFCSFNLLLADEPIEIHDDFSNGSHEWIADFADYPVGEESFYELNWGWGALPSSSTEEHQGVYISGNNHSDDLFMFVKKRVSGLQPNTEYAVVLDVTIWNDIPSGLIGVGGSPGEGITVKIGASAVEPLKTDKDGFYRMNIDKGEQTEGGKDAVVVGDLANELVDADNPQFAPKQFDNRNYPIKVKTDATGTVWLLFGTDSGFESATKYYLTDIHVSISLSNDH